ncbi:MAG: helix-turn-helix transcriptional regulator [Clostridia bacterium]|nr:helix-turn-helix transcriptional regulator [Clostridia bacterium]
MNKYFKHKLQNLLLISKIVTVHYAKLDKHFAYTRESHDFWEIIFAEKDNLICRLDDKTITLKDGEIYFHKPNEAHLHQADGINAPTIFIASFVCHSPAMRFFENRIVKLNKRQIRYVHEIVEEAKKTFNIPFFNPDMKKMELLPHPTLGGEQLIKNHLELLLIDVMRSLTETEYGNSLFFSINERIDKFVSDVIKILNDNVYGKLSISDVCKKINYSKAYVFKNFKAVTGKSVMEYYSEIKIAQAKKLLYSEDLSIKEISEKLCFDTPNYFTKSFKKATGVTPTEYKKRASI